MNATLFVDLGVKLMDDALNEGQTRQLKRIKELLLQQMWSQASSQLEQLYQESHQSDINHLLVEALYMDSQYQMAYEYAAEDLDSYLLTADLYKLVVNVHLKSRHLIKARQFAMSTKHAEWRSTAINGIEEFEQATTKTLAKTYRENLRQFYHLGDTSFVEQRRRFDQADQLPLPQYLIGAKFLLRDPFTHPLVRSSILQVIQSLGIEETVKVHWLDEQEYQIKCQSLVSLNQDPTFISGVVEIKKQVGQTDPLAYQMILQEFQLQAMLCYPLINKVVTDPKEWIKLLIDQFHGRQGSSDEISATKQWQIKLSSLLATLE